MSDEIVEPVVVGASGWRVLTCRQPPWVLDYSGKQAECVERLAESDETAMSSGWRLHGDVVVMSAELELAAWTTAGVKLWTTFVEPSWSYSVEGSTLRLDVMGKISEFPLRSGR